MCPYAQGLSSCEGTGAISGAGGPILSLGGSSPSPRGLCKVLFPFTVLAWVGVCGGYREGWCSCVSTVDDQMRMKSREVQSWAQHPWSLSQRIGMEPRAGSRVWRGRGGGREHLPLPPPYPHLFPLSLLYPLPLVFLPPSFLLPCPSLLIPPPSLSLTKHSPSAPWVPEKGRSRDEAQLLWG